MTELSNIATYIEIEAIPRHEEGHNVPGSSIVFSYLIRITNKSEETVKLLRRHWYITDGSVAEREVEGVGVVGETPVIYPGDTFEYQSWCPLLHHYGVMRGYYTFEKTETTEQFRVSIPPILLMSNHQLN